MKKINDINELVNELNEYDGELTVNVWSQGANKAYPISHVCQGHTDGVLDTYVSIVVDDDRNLVDLSKIWNDESEEPQGKYYIVCQDTFENVFPIHSIEVMTYHQSWEKFVMCECIVRWAYVKDLFPKGGKI